MKIVGIDLSLASTGLALVVLDADGVPRASVDRVLTKPAGDDLAARLGRLRDIRAHAAVWVTGADLVVIEGLAYASTSPRATERAGLWWLVVARLLEADVPVAVVAPTARAKYATGKGNAGKDAVLAAVVRRYPNVDVTGNDEADALVLAAMGARHLGRPIDDLPQTHLAAMSSVSWPDSEELMHTSTKENR